MSYQLTACGVLRLSDGAHIPPDPFNRDWFEYQAWLSSGGQALPMDELPGATGTLKTLANKWLARSNRQP
ncbi:hypothetical protein JRG42_20445 [Pseudomonas granadensis]|uniref:Uncharacterized protein n=1 Tax=Pseudomonas granadensis TaxID=1421430 RepID=A0ABX7GNK6_9PSED|nr:hypothetical protein [Pseudomonas granadensis]MBN6775513.1 hypothetical protein [Pseudomonas granadensis]MBN6806806.1 hypothetical protein [Pseudomonas granadensis]MBN6833537.1 hypothetical protein [Pseudomonas granadensis]MBN6841052.1 hypothetical protein [Pseudomonas granadensis]MBN6866545.1 hypothetical protein [Pseudomonas granadensis]